MTRNNLDEILRNRPLTQHLFPRLSANTRCTNVCVHVSGHIKSESISRFRNLNLGCLVSTVGLALNEPSFH